MRKKEIRETRKAAGLTQRAAAELVGVDVSSWERYENGLRNMRAGTWTVFLDRIQDLVISRDKDAQITRLELQIEELKDVVRKLAAIQDVEAPEIAQDRTAGPGAVG